MATNVTRKAPDEIDKAVAAAKKAVGRLARLLGDGDRAVLYKAASALAEIGPFVIGPLEAALPRTAARTPPSHLRSPGPEQKTHGPVIAAMSRAIGREKDPDVRARAGAALSDLIAHDARRRPVRSRGVPRHGRGLRNGPRSALEGRPGL